MDSSSFQFLHRAILVLLCKLTEDKITDSSTVMFSYPYVIILKESELNS